MPHHRMSQYMPGRQPHISQLQMPHQLMSQHMPQHQVPQQGGAQPYPQKPAAQLEARQYEGLPPSAFDANRLSAELYEALLTDPGRAAELYETLLSKVVELGGELPPDLPQPQDLVHLPALGVHGRGPPMFGHHRLPHLNKRSRSLNASRLPVHFKDGEPRQPIDPYKLCQQIPTS